MGTPSLAINKHFGTLKDPRLDRRKRHLLIDVITIAICGVVCGCDDWQQIAVFGKNRKDWLGQFLQLSNGIPSHDTFERVFDRIDPAAFGRCFRAWTNALCDALALKHIAIDGKTLRGSGRASGTAKLKPLHLVSAWASAQQLTLGQVAVDDKSNEITAIPELLDLLCIKGALVTIDAMGCQKEIAAKIRDAGGDYILAVKDNQPTLHADIQDSFIKAFETDFKGLDYDQFETYDRGHGRRETRSYTIIKNPESLTQKDLWRDLNVIGVCTSVCIVGNPDVDPDTVRESTEVRYFIGSRKANAKTYGQAFRSHWGIESMHWSLDVSYAEDKSRVAKRNGAENLASVRRLTLALLKRHPSKQSIACKRLNAALDVDFLEEVLRGNTNLGNV
jgi:predicted transposase YbfD/YdcC